MAGALDEMAGAGGNLYRLISLGFLASDWPTLRIFDHFCIDDFPFWESGRRTHEHDLIAHATLRRPSDR